MKEYLQIIKSIDYHIFKYSFRLESNNFYQHFLQVDSAERAQSIFSTLDLDGNGEITEDEFVKGCMEDEDMVYLLYGDKADTEEVYDDQD